jgi:hypothetical protein
MHRHHRHHSRRRGAALAALLAGAAASLLPAGAAFAQEPPPPPGAAAGPEAGAPPRSDGERRGPGWHRGGPRHHDRERGPRGGREFSTLRLAEALAGMEVALGIRPDQMDAWRGFTGALVAFADSMRPPMRGPGGPGGPGGPDAQVPPPATVAPDGVPSPAPGAPGGDDADEAGDPEARVPPLDRLERFADRAVQTGERAERLKVAIATLRTTLTPEQAELATRLARDFMRDMHRGDGPRGPRGDRAERGERGGDRAERGERGGDRDRDRQERREREDRGGDEDR